MNGVLIVYKEAGFTSFDVVAKLRGILRQKKIGHTGTLDPAAEGLMIILLGRAAKLSDLVTAKDKRYSCVMRLGVITDTDDMTGTVKEERGLDALLGPDPDEGKKAEAEEKIRQVLAGFRGKQLQIPPAYSAIRVKGRRLYEYARAGEEIRPDPREIEIYDIRTTEISLPLVKFSVHCSKGTYIRGICRDAGARLGTGGAMEKLLREETGGFSLKDAHRLSEIQEAKDRGEVEKLILPMDVLLQNVPALSVREEGKALLKNGNPLGERRLETSEKLPLPDLPESRRKIFQDAPYVRIYRGSDLAALYSWHPDRQCYMCFRMLEI